jgi:hypothetical protein
MTASPDSSKSQFRWETVSALSYPTQAEATDCFDPLLKMNSRIVALTDSFHRAELIPQNDLAPEIPAQKIWPRLLVRSSSGRTF